MILPRGEVGQLSGRMKGSILEKDKRRKYACWSGNYKKRVYNEDLKTVDGATLAPPTAWRPMTPEEREYYVKIGFLKGAVDG